LAQRRRSAALEAEIADGDGSLRLCAATRAARSPDDLIRFVAGPDGTLVPDLARKLPGRGVWVTADRASLQQAIKTKAFARSLKVDLRGRGLAISDCWVNVMPSGVVHSLHLHPTSFISGTYYVQVPKGAGALKFEDPRLSKMMAAPPRPSFVSLPAKAGEAILFESWLRHEVPPARYAGERISISFNYTWSAR